MSCIFTWYLSSNSSLSITGSSDSTSSTSLRVSSAISIPTVGTNACGSGPLSRETANIISLHIHDFFSTTAAVSCHHIEPCQWKQTVSSVIMRRTYSKSPRRHRRASSTQPRTMGTTGAGHSQRIVNQLI